MMASVSRRSIAYGLGVSCRSATRAAPAGINVMSRAADKAARGLKRDFGEVEQLQVSQKGPADFVSVADLRAERVLRSELGKARPGYGFLLEEGGAAPGSDPHNRWVVDPLDGRLDERHRVLGSR